jgi:hypothetical protein
MATFCVRLGWRLFAAALILSDPTAVRADLVDAVAGLEQVFSVALSPDGAHVYTVGSGEGAIGVFGRDGRTFPEDRRVTSRGRRTSCACDHWGSLLE